MATTSATATVTEGGLQDLAKRHLWMHFTRHGAYDDGDVPIIVRGEGPYVWDERGNRYLDGLSALFCVNAGHGLTELGDAAARQVAELDFYTLWSYAHPRAIELATRIASLAPEGLNRVFFTSGGSEAVESAIKLARSYHQRTGNSRKTKFITREVAYHGTTLGALARTRTAITGHPTATRSGPRIRSRRRSSTSIPTRSPRSSWSRCRTPGAASRHRTATSSGCARSAIATTCC
jgi:adenosylmethionine-8-amino-7-oxononanoate aminotransferase